MSEIERLRAHIIDLQGQLITRNAELCAAADEIERLRAGGCARNQRLTQYCAEVPAAVLAEREACARIADAWAEHTGVDDLLLLAAAIRARSEEAK